MESNNDQVILRDVQPGDVAVFYEQQRDPEANRIAAFTSRNPYDRTAFEAHWSKVLADSRIVIQTILAGGQVAGYVLHHSWFGDPEVSYWLGRDFWGKGVASSALAQFLRQAALRPLYGRAARDNLASLRVLEKCGFTLIGQSREFSNARGEEVDELILILKE